jgi:hypothetical protein
MSAFIILFYLLPAAIAWWKHHQQAFAITVLNLLLGWTLIGWIAAFIWACLSDAPDDRPSWMRNLW